PCQGMITDCAYSVETLHATSLPGPVGVQAGKVFMNISVSTRAEHAEVSVASVSSVFRILKSRPFHFRRFFLNIPNTDFDGLIRI
ncbi:MAG: hypothetical protein R6U64_08435, partial [Bacteroidales bacterium]